MEVTESNGSQPSWAAWIEIGHLLSIRQHFQSQPSWAAWIEMATGKYTGSHEAQSQPSWAAWIEIQGTV